MVDFLGRVEDIRMQLESFDRELSDNIRPLALIFDGLDTDGKGAFEAKKPGDMLSNNYVFQQVIDKICQINFQNPGAGPLAIGAVPTQKQNEYKHKIEEQINVLHTTLNLV
mgnify:CR=1 FL=1